MGKDGKDANHGKNGNDGNGINDDDDDNDCDDGDDGNDTMDERESTLKSQTNLRTTNHGHSNRDDHGQGGSDEKQKSKVQNVKEGDLKGNNTKNTAMSHTFDVRAQRLKEIQQLWFFDHSKGKRDRSRSKRKHDSKNMELKDKLKRHQSVANVRSRSPDVVRTRDLVRKQPELNRCQTAPERTSMRVMQSVSMEYKE